jgi:hypothetical protein
MPEPRLRCSRVLVSPGGAAWRKHPAAPGSGRLVPGGVPRRGISGRCAPGNVTDLRICHRSAGRVGVNLDLMMADLGIARANLGTDLGILWGGTGE